MFFCPDCHVSNRSDAKFCRRCGRSRSDLERAEVSVAVAAPTASVAEAPGAHSSETSGVSMQETSGASMQETSGVSIPETPGAPSVHVSTSEQQPLAEPELFTQGEAIDELQVSVETPALAVNIEQEVSLSAPPDLNSPECPSCWKALRATDKFCCWCGEAQPNRVLPFLKLCLECSTFLPEKANYCYSCGTDVGYSSRRKVRVPHELFKDEESEFFPRFDA